MRCCKVENCKVKYFLHSSTTTIKAHMVHFHKKYITEKYPDVFMEAKENSCTAKTFEDPYHFLSVLFSKKHLPYSLVEDTNACAIRNSRALTHIYISK